MNLVFVNDNAQINGGAAKLAITEALGLAENGHKIYFVCAVPPIAPELVHPGIEVLSTGQPDLLSHSNPIAAFAQGWWNLQAARLIRDLLRRLGDETVVHFHIWSRALSSSVLAEVVAAGVPSVCTLHDFTLACPTSTFFLHREQAPCPLQPLSARCVATNCDTRSYAQKLWRVGRLLIQKYLAHAPSGVRHYIAHSSLAEDVMRPHLPAEAVVHRLPIYSSADRQEPADPASHSGFVYLGRLVREKGVLLLGRAAHAEGVAVTFVGSGPMEDELRRICPGANITGWRNAAESTEYLRQARALVFPSLWYETLGLVVLEAAAQGIPSLVPDTSAAREVVIDGVTGLYFRGGDEADLQRKLRQLQDADFAAKLGRAAYEHFWSSPFPSLPAHLSGLEAIYRAVLQGVPVTSASPPTLHKEHTHGYA